MIKKCFVYSRSACVDQHTNSQILNQISLCKKYAKKEGLKVVREFADIGVGSHQPKRNLYEMITACHEENVFTIVTARPDRLSRDAAELFVIKKVLNELNIKIMFVNGDEYEQKMLFVCTGINRRTNIGILNRRAKTILSRLRQAQWV